MQFFIKLVYGSFIKQLGKLTDFFPSIFSVFCSLLKAAEVLLFISRIFKSAATAATGTDLPPNSAPSFKVIFKKILIVLLDMRIDAPTFAINDYLYKVAFKGRNIITSNVRINVGSEFAFSRFRVL